MPLMNTKAADCDCASGAVWRVQLLLWVDSWTRTAGSNIIGTMSRNMSRLRLCVERLEPRLCMAFGALDSSFGADGFVRFENMRTADSEDEAYAVAAYPDGSVVMAGTSEVGRGAVSSFAKLDSAGRLVTSFGVNGRVLLPYALTATTAVAASDGGLYISGARLIDDAYRDVVMRMLGDGTIDSSFGGVGYYIVDTSPYSHPRLVPTSDAGVAVLAHKISSSPLVPSDYRIWKLDSAGQLDASFGTAGVTQSFDPCFPLPASTGPSSGVHFLKDDAGRLLVAGQVYSQTQQTHYLRLLRFTLEGTLDTTFGDQGHLQDLVAVSPNFRVAAEEAGGGAVLVVWSDAKSTSTTIYARRLYADGTADMSFGSDGLLASPALPSSVNPFFSAVPLLAANGPGRTLVTVPRQETLSSYRFITLVIGADGQFDTAFGQGGVGQSTSYEYSYLNQVARSLMRTARSASRRRDTAATLRCRPSTGACLASMPMATRTRPLARTGRPRSISLSVRPTRAGWICSRSIRHWSSCTVRSSACATRRHRTWATRRWSTSIARVTPTQNTRPAAPIRWGACTPSTGSGGLRSAMADC